MDKIAEQIGECIVYMVMYLPVILLLGAVLKFFSY